MDGSCRDAEEASAEFGVLSGEMMQHLLLRPIEALRRHEAFSIRFRRQFQVFEHDWKF